MELPDSAQENLQFLCSEIDGQLARLQAYLAAPSDSDARALLDREGYAQNLCARIQKSCLAALADSAPDSAEARLLHSMNVIAGELEQVCGLCRECVAQTTAMQATDDIEPETCQRMLQRVRRGVGQIDDALFGENARLAMKIGGIDRKLDKLFSKLQDHYVEALNENQNTEDLVRALFIAHAIERMGNALLNISESILSTRFGHSMSLPRYRSLQSTLASLDLNADPEDIQVDELAETRSGGSISALSHQDDDGDEQMAVFKDGARRKLKEEKVGFERWHDIEPGIAPRVISWTRQGKSAAMLIQHLPGLTFEQVLLQESPLMQEQSLATLTETLPAIWDRTRKPEPVHAGFMRQLRKRIDEVYRLHPEYQRNPVELCGRTVAGFDTLIEQASKQEQSVAAPWSVYIHGDFNIDNVLYDPDQKRIHFIDLHRTRQMDYVQDVSVFMVSNYRLQTLDRELRRRVMRLVRRFYAQMLAYAKAGGDDSFEWRMAFGLARSFASSTRFILDKTLSRDMFLRARYLLELITSEPDREVSSFQLPVEELFVA